MAKGQYQLMYNTAFADYDGNDAVEIGKVVDTASGADVMYVFYQKNLHQERGFHLCVDIFKDDTREFPIARVDDLHRSCLFENPDVFLAIMLHELGHYVNGDLHDTSRSARAMAEERMQCIMAGTVPEMEHKADAFAVASVGKNTFMRSLDYLKKKRMETMDNSMVYEVKEFELRKKAARNLK